jgi:hypothetical protein
MANPFVVQSDDHGWVIVYWHYQIKWFDREQVPQSICQVLGMSDTDPDDSDDVELGDMMYGSDDNEDEWE